MELYGNLALCYVVSIDDKSEHFKRSKGRTEEMSMSPEENIYVKNQDQITEIQEFIIKKAYYYNKKLKENSPLKYAPDKLQHIHDVIPEDDKNYIHFIDNTNIVDTMNKIDEIFQ